MPSNASIALRGVLDRHRRARLCAARHHFRHPPHRIGQGRQRSRCGIAIDVQARVTDRRRVVRCRCQLWSRRGFPWRSRPCPPPTCSATGLRHAAQNAGQARQQGGGDARAPGVPARRTGVPSPNSPTRSLPLDVDGEADAIEGDACKLRYRPLRSLGVRGPSASRGAKAHPTPLVQSAAMAAVSHPGA